VSESLRGFYFEPSSTSELFPPSVDRAFFPPSSIPPFVILFKILPVLPDCPERIGHKAASEPESWAFHASVFAYQSLFIAFFFLGPRSDLSFKLLSSSVKRLYFFIIHVVVFFRSFTLTRAASAEPFPGFPLFSQHPILSVFLFSFPSSFPPFFGFTFSKDLTRFSRSSWHQELDFDHYGVSFLASEPSRRSLAASVISLPAPAPPFFLPQQLSTESVPRDAPLCWATGPFFAFPVFL